jgi:hypothetical protein
MALVVPPVLPAARRPILAFKFCLVEVLSDTPSSLTYGQAGPKTGLFMLVLFNFLCAPGGFQISIVVVDEINLLVRLVGIDDTNLVASKMNDWSHFLSID